jgi:pilus assembly protein CpaC
MIPRAKRFMSALAGFIIVILVAAPEAQQQAPAFVPVSATAPGAPRASADAPTDIDLLVGRSTILNVGTPITRVSLTVPDVADAMVTAPSQLLIHGKQPGTISLFVWDKGGTIKTYEVTVRRDLSALIEQYKSLFPGETIAVAGSGKDVVISGTVAGQYVIDKAGEVAAGYVEKKENVVNLLKQQEGIASNQVMLRVRFAEVSRSAMQELGASYFANGFKQNWYGRVTPEGVTGPNFDDQKGLVFSDFLNLFVFNSKEGLGAVVRALSNKGLFQSLAEPNLIATNGKEASFLAGGEYPYPVLQTGSGNNAITIMFKEFGVRLSFTPTVLGGDLVNIKVKPEVSSLDFANAVDISGFRIPALSTRRTETEVELRDGQTFAIAGLMNNTLTSTMSKIPGIGDIPILGKLFQSKAHQKNQTELVVLITPSIIKRGQMGVSEGLPSLVEPYLGAPAKTHPNPDAYVGSPRYPVTPGVKKPTTGQEPAPAPQAAPGGSKATAEMPEPVARPIQGTATLPQVPVVETPAPVQVERPAQALQTPVVEGPAPAPVTPKLTKAEMRALEQQREAEQKAAAAAAKHKAEEDKRQAEADRVAAKKAEEDRRAADKLARERSTREAEVAKKNAEVARKKATEDQKREKALADAAARLKQAQAEYQAEMEKTKGIKK